MCGYAKPDDDECEDRDSDADDEDSELCPNCDKYTLDDKTGLCPCGHNNNRGVPCTCDWCMEHEYAIPKTLEPKQETPITRHINVWSCCGVFGWSCPWSEWQGVKGTFIRPCYNSTEEYVVLYSLKGQMVQQTRDMMEDVYVNTIIMPPNILGRICMDRFVRDDGKVDWEAIRSEIVRVHDCERAHRKKAEENRVRDSDKAWLKTKTEAYKLYAEMAQISPDTLIKHIIGEKAQTHWFWRMFGWK